MESRQQEVTQVLVRASNGDEVAAEALWSLIYEELRRIAHRQLQRERQGHTLSTTALVHEAYLRLIDHKKIDWKDRGHFYGLSARAMRNILVDYARRRNAQKRGGGRARVTLEEGMAFSEDQMEDLIALDSVLTRLSEMDPRLGQVIEYRYFAGLTAEETAEVLDVSLRTVQRDWIKARGWLYKELYGDL